MTRNLLIVLFLAFPSLSFGAYVMPIGIPDPALSWGGTQDPIDDIAPTRPATWTTEQAGYYYVNDDEAGCSNSRPYGYPGFARCAIPYPIPVGSRVEVGGTYSTGNSGSNLYLEANGTSAAWSAGTAGPVWIVGEAGAVVTLKPLIKQSEYLYIDNLDFYFSSNGDTIKIGTSSVSTWGQNDHIAIRNCDISGNGEGGALTHAVSLIGYADNDKPDNIVLYNNNMHDHSYPDYHIDNGFIDQDSHVVIADQYVDNLYVLGNTVAWASGSGIVAGQDAYNDARRIDNFYVGGNTIHDTLQAGIATKGVNLAIFSQNHIHHQHTRYQLGWTAKSPGKNIGYGDNTNGPIYYLFNVMHDARFGVHGGGTAAGDPTFYMIGNIVYNIGEWESYATWTQGTSAWDSASLSAAYFTGATNVYMYDNTFYDIEGGLYLASTGFTSITMKGNIMSGLKSPNSMFICIGDQSGLITANIDKNIFNATGNTYAARSTSTYYNTVADIVAGTTACDNCLTSDPAFVNAAGADFNLTASSPAIGAGEEAATYDSFLTTYSLDIQVDASGAARPVSTWDIGAYEYDEGYTPPAPTCSDLIQNGDETGVDCGGSCPACEQPPVEITLRNGKFRIGGVASKLVNQ